VRRLRDAALRHGVQTVEGVVGIAHALHGYAVVGKREACPIPGKIISSIRIAIPLAEVSDLCLLCG
jgi:hypothetical protein